MRYRNRLSLLIGLVGLTAGCVTPDKRTTVAPYCPTTWNAHLTPVVVARAGPTAAPPAPVTPLARLPVVVVIRETSDSPAVESKGRHEILQASLTQIPLPPPTLMEDREVVWITASGP